MRPVSLSIPLLSATYQFIANLLETQTALDHEYKQVIEKIGSFFNEKVRILILCRNDGLAGFFADFLEYFVQTLIEQISGVRAFRPAALSRFHHRVKIAEHVANVGLVVRDL